MKNILLLLTLLIGLQTANAQYVTIPDSNFRAALKIKYPTCFNASDMMDTTCSSVENATNLNVSNKNITSLEGIRFFKNLIFLNCSKNILTSLSILPEQLNTLSCNNNKLVSLPKLPNTLEKLNCYNNLLTSLPTLPNTLIDLYCRFNKITSLPTLPNTLTYLEVWDNQLVSLPILPDSLLYLDIWGNKITTLPTLPNNLKIMYCDSNNLTMLPNIPSRMEELYCSNNKLSSLINIPNSLKFLDLSNNLFVNTPSIPNTLTYLACGKNNITTISSLPDSLNYFDCDSNNLTSLPIIPSKLKTLYCNNNAISCLPALPSDMIALHIKGTSIACLPNTISNNAVVDSIVPICTSTCTYSSKFVYIPDSSFRNYLKTKYPTCFDIYGYMDTTCTTIINEDTINVNNRNISSLQGIQYFTKLKYLFCDTNRLVTIPSLSNILIKLYCNKNKLVSLPTLPNTLTHLYCSSNQLVSLPILPNTLRILSCPINKIITLPTLPITLQNLECSYNQLMSLPSLPITLKYLYCYRNRITSLPDLPNSLVSIDCSNNRISTLPILPTLLSDLVCINNELATLPSLPNSLQYLLVTGNHLTSLPTLPSSLLELFVGSNHLTSLPTQPNSLVTLWCINNPLNCLPLLPSNMNNLYIKRTMIQCLPNAISGTVDTILPICTNASNICEVNPFVQGKIYNDVNNNGIYNTGEQLVSQQIVKVLPNNWLGASDANGNYLVKLDTAINNTWSAINNYRYATITPTSYSLANIHDLGLQNGSYDFGVHIIPNVKDLETTLGSSPARPGFTTNVSISTNNVGTVNQSNITIKLKKPNGFNVLSSSIAPTSTSNDTLIWNNISINYLEHQSINIQLQVPVNAVLGDSAVYEAWSNGIQGDSTPLDNYARWKETIRGSFDPNDKLVNKTTLPPTYNANKDRLLYTIRFQNTGTDTAFTVIVRDVVLNNIDVASLRVVNASHKYQLIVREKDIVEVAFPNIQLPAKTQNEAKSHGFVQLEFKPKAGLPVNAEINNNASIFFDYNAPVITNTAQTKVQITTSVANNRKLNFKLFPNPTSSTITVELPYTGNGNYYLTDISGKVIQQNSIENNVNSFNIDVNDIANGTYLLAIEINGNVSTSKVVIVR